MRRLTGLPIAVLRMSRFFPEDDDSKTLRSEFSSGNAKLNELAYRRVDIEDAVEACLLGLERAPATGFGRYIISATTPFRREDAGALRINAPDVLFARCPQARAGFDVHGWRFFPAIDRIYDNTLARSDLGWRPRHDIVSAAARLALGGELESDLAHAIGAKGYHDRVFVDGPYPVG